MAGIFVTNSIDICKIGTIAPNLKGRWHQNMLNILLMLPSKHFHCPCYSTTSLVVSHSSCWTLTHKYASHAAYQCANQCNALVAAALFADIPSAATSIIIPRNNNGSGRKAENTTEDGFSCTVVVTGAKHCPMHSLLLQSLAGMGLTVYFGEFVSKWLGHFISFPVQGILELAGWPFAQPLLHVSGTTSGDWLAHLQWNTCQKQKKTKNFVNYLCLSCKEIQKDMPPFRRLLSTKRSKNRCLWKSIKL